ncbi:peptidase family M1-domain-containing protein [Haematococcus lacustris]
MLLRCGLRACRHLPVPRPNRAFSYRAPRTLRIATMALTDPTSFANHQQIRVSHADLQLDVNFERKELEGYMELTAVVEGKAGAEELVLDTSSGLAIHRVELLQPGTAPPAPPSPLSHHWGEPHKALGRPLHIPLPSPQPLGSRVCLGVRFTTPPGSSALQWLEPSQTAGGQHPYLFSQCQAIHARALVPCQDSPGAKMTYTAKVRVPAELTALMSAVPDSEQDAAAGGSLDKLPEVQPPYPTKVFHFTQKVPIPPYLLALVVGELASRELGPRSRVWSEPSQVEAGAYEFADTASFLEAGEALAGPYVWGRYDLLLMPPSFPYGGMENPQLTFVTPTLLAGDQSLTNVIAHEIAHSWSGNLVTNATWQDFWLNEGWTVFIERKILGRLHGEATRQFHASRGALDLAEDVARFGVDHPYTRLVPDMTGGIDPDDVFSKIPYEKGFYLLYYLEGLVGGPAVFEPFMRAYLAAHAFKTVTSQGFKDFVLNYFKDNEAIGQIDWDAWYHAPGLPPVTNTYDSSLAQAAYSLAKRWHTADVMGIGSSGPEGAGPDDIESWSSEQTVAFLDKLTEFRAMQPMHASMTQKMAAFYRLYATNNAEIRASFFRLALEAEDPEVLPHVTAMLGSQGRMKYLRPLYRAMFKSKMGKQLAVDTFLKHKPGYHPIAQKMVAADLGIST